MICMDDKKTIKTAKSIDVNHILVETDSPYLAPEEKRGQKNTSLNIGYIIQKLSHELDMKEDEVIETTTRNAKRLFRL